MLDAAFKSRSNNLSECFRLAEKYALTVAAVSVYRDLLIAMERKQMFYPEETPAMFRRPVTNKVGNKVQKVDVGGGLNLTFISYKN